MQSPIYAQLTSSDEESDDDIDVVGSTTNSPQSFEAVAVVKVELQECVRCRERFQTKDRLKQHVIQEHLPTQNYSVCLHCDGEREFRSHQTYVAHSFKRHFGLDLSTCKNCKKTFLFDCDTIFHRALKDCSRTPFFAIS